ncbi:MAG TPA: peptidase S16 [Parvularcula sp.]|nr:peptidase S16 [Parvularcula sp.]HBS31191.1 peptidase S16 [Parvularcula sp.]HBS35001.1 peptidase S16 [Parvularcula sp.]
MTAGARAVPTRSPRALPAVIPVFPLTGAILLPKGMLPLNIFEPRYLRMFDDALAGARVIGMIQPREDDSAARAPLYEVGCAGRITAFQETGDGRYLVSLSGLSRFRVGAELDAATPYRQVNADYSGFPSDMNEDRTGEAVDRERLFDAMRGYFASEGLSTDWQEAAAAPTAALVNSLAMGCPFAPNEKQALLEAGTLADRADCLIALMRMSGGEAPDEPILQ